MESCKLKGLVSATMWYKEVLLEELILNKIIYLEDISQKSINNIVQYWTKEKPSCTRKQIANLKAFLNHCIKSQKFNSSTYHSIVFPTTSNTGVRETIVTDIDYKKILSKIKDKDFRLYLTTLWETGCRPNEITNLKKSDIDFTKGTARIYQNKVKKYKVIYFTDKLLTLFEGIQNEYIFQGHDKQKEFYAKKFKDIKEQLNLNKEYCLYAFRHTAATNTIESTNNIYLAQKLLGHMVKCFS